MKKIKVLIVGSMAVDSIETPEGKVDRAMGGSASYAAVASSYLAPTGIVAVVGHDFEKKYINLLERRGIDLTGLQVDPHKKTFHWSGYYEGDMNEAHSRSTCLNAFEDFSPRLPQDYRRADCVLLGNIHPALQLEVLDQVQRPRLVLCDTMNFWISGEPRLLEKVFRRSDVLCINEGEARQFCGVDSLPRAARELLKLGPKRIIIKRGSHGCTMFGRDSFFALPAVPLEKIKDPTGAGDSFAGGFVGAVARGRNLNEDSFRRGLVLGTVMASYCVEEFSVGRTS